MKASGKKAYRHPWTDEETEKEYTGKGSVKMKHRNPEWMKR